MAAPDRSPTPFPGPEPLVARKTAPRGSGGQTLDREPSSPGDTRSLAIDSPVRGAVAQLEEHHVRNVGVEGSNPFCSTRFVPFLAAEATEGSDFRAPGSSSPAPRSSLPREPSRLAFSDP